MNAAHKRIVVTGTSRGLGRAMAAGFIDEGHTVLGCARSQEAMDEARRRWGTPHRFDVVDVADDAAVAAWAGAVLADGEPPNLLVNNAAVINRNALLWEVPVDEFSRLIDINIKGVVNVIRHFVPAMIEQGSGVIVNFSSGWGRSVAPEVAPYCTSKWALEGLTRALAEELPSGMAAVALSPGVIHTDMLKSCFGPAASSHPSPAQWAKAAVPFILGLGPDDNGESRIVEGVA